MSIFEFSDYRQYLKGHIKSLPRKGRGELSKIARHLNVNTTLISQIMSGARDFTAEQTYSLSLYLAHSEIEIDYFSNLIQLHRAGTVELKKHIHKKLLAIRNEALKLSKRIVHEKNLLTKSGRFFIQVGLTRPFTFSHLSKRRA